MRTNIDIDDELLAEAMNLTGQKTKKGMIAEALTRIVRSHRQHQAVLGMAGLGWDGDEEQLRREWDFGDDK